MTEIERGTQPRSKIQRKEMEDGQRERKERDLGTDKPEAGSNPLLSNYVIHT